MKPLRLVFVVLTLLRAIPAQADVPPEYKLKAAFLFNFAKFVNWPPKVFVDTTTPIVIGVLGDDPFGTALEEIVHGRTINGRPLTIHRARRLEELPDCHLLFISRSEQKNMGDILTRLSERPVLTVSDTADFLNAGGAIGFLMEGQSIRFEIDAGTAERAGLKIDAQLLSLAKTVRGKG